jgi:phenylacetate-CoA ligase
MPLIRYRNGDVLSIDDTPCPCGRRLARATVHGRSFDMVRLRDGTIIDSTFFEKLMDPQQVARFLLHQRTYDRVDVHIVPTDGFSDSYGEHLLREVRARTRMSDIRLLLEEELDVELVGKYRLVRSDVSAQMVH